MIAVPSLKVTDPAIVPRVELGSVAATVAVKATGAPANTGFVRETNVVLVGAVMKLTVSMIDMDTEGVLLASPA